MGRYAPPPYFDPSAPPQCDYLICESTYGDRDHPAVDVMRQLTDTVLAAVRLGISLEVTRQLVRQLRGEPL